MIGWINLNVGAYLTGAFGQSQELYIARNEAKRDRGSPETVGVQILKDTKEIIGRQTNAGLSFIVDPMFNFDYLFQAFAEHVDGVSVGSQENWFNNNVFYWRPQISGPLKSQNTGFTSASTHIDLLPKDGKAMAILPSPSKSLP